MTKSVKSRLISGNNFLTMKINFKFYYLFLILFFLLLNKAYSFDTDCSRFLDDLKNNYNKYSLGDYPTIIQKNYGFEIHKKFDQSKDEFVFARDKNEYFSVGKLLSPIVYNKGLRIGDKILSINDVDVRSLSEGEISNILLNDSAEKITLEFKNKNIVNKIELEKIETEHVEKILVVDLKSLQINEKEGTFTSNISLNFVINYGDNHKIVNFSDKHMSEFFEDTGKWETYLCEYDWKEWGDTGMPFPNVKHENRIEYNLNLVQYYVDVYAFLKKTGFYDQDSVEVTYYDEGLMKFSHNYNLRNFPFDKQKLKIEISNKIDIERELLRYSDYSPRNLNNFINKASLSGWNLLGSEIRYETSQNPNNLEGYYDDKLIIEILVERKHGYYIYKVIFPILLILLVCWSAVWIEPEQLESRLTITIVCLLSLIAYNFVIDSELPKLDYLTVMDYIILISYIYATIPNFLSILSFANIKTKNKNFFSFEVYCKKYGVLSYILIIFLVVFFNANQDPQTAALFGWLVAD